MNGKFNVVKGRINEAVGALTGNKRLKAKGKAEQLVGKVETKAKEELTDARKSAREMVEVAKDTADRTVEKAKHG